MILHKAKKCVPSSMFVGKSDGDNILGNRTPVVFTVELSAFNQK